MKLRIPSHTLMTGRSSALPALALFSLATMSAQGVSVLLDDNFTNAVRVGATNARTGVDRDGVATLTNDWVMALNTTTAATQTSDSNAPRVATGINGNSLAVTNTGLAYSLSTYFTPTTLAPGESISATFNVRTTGFTVLALDTAFRFGLFDSNSGQLAANSNFSGGAGSAIGTVFQDDRGYAAYYDTTTGISTGTHEFRERISAGAANNSNLFTPGQFSTLVGGVTAAGKPYRPLHA